MAKAQEDNPDATQSANPAKKGGARKIMGQGLIGLLLVAAVAIVFFVFYVGPQSQFERERIFRSMNLVSRLIDDRTLATVQGLQTWKGDNNTARDEAARTYGIAGFEFGCGRNNIICIEAVGDERPETNIVEERTASFSLRSIAESAQLPYPEAILLITDSRGNVIAGHDMEGKWLQFQSLETLLDTASQNASDEADDNQASRLLRSAQRFGRGEENRVFEGYPARLSRDIGGQTFAVFVASHQLGKSLTEDSISGYRTIVRAGGPTDAAAATADGGTNANAAEDQLFFAYVIPERVIDRTALGIPYQWMVNILILLLVGLLSIPFLKLFNLSPVKPIRIRDMVAVLISTMLVVMTASLMLSAILLRNSVVQDIGAELNRLSGQVAGEVAEGLLPREIEDFPPQSANLAMVENAFMMGASGRCRGDDAIADCGRGGIWFSEPVVENIDVVDRAYFQAWKDHIKIGDQNYAQFLKNKSNGKLSWARLLDQDDGPLVKAGQSGRRGLLVSWFPLSLRSPVVARNFAFAIVLNTDLPQPLKGPGSRRLGDVQFHSDVQFSLMENILDEARGNPQLTAALQTMRNWQTGSGDQSSASALIPINYHGSNYFAMVRPIANSPWSVVALYDRTETLAMFAEAIARAFFLSCLWILVCVAASWLAPRLLRLTLARGPRDRRRKVNIRARSIWFFPNGLFDYTPDGFSYFFRMRADEVILLLFTLSVQTAGLVFLPPRLAIIAVCGISLVALVGHYLLIARPHASNRRTHMRRIGIAFAAALFAAALSFALLMELSDWWFLFGTIMLIACFLCLNLGLIWSFSPRLTERLKQTPALHWLEAVAPAVTRRRKGSRTPTTHTVRRAFVNRAIALLLVLVWVPCVAFLNFHYTEYLKGYAAANLVTVSEEIGEQRFRLNNDLVPVTTSKTDFRIDPSRLDDILNLSSFDKDHPGWFLKGPGPDTRRGPFLVSAEELQQPLAADGSGSGDASMSLLAESFSYDNYFMPDLGVSDLELDRSIGMLSVKDWPSLTITLLQPEEFETITGGLGRGTEGRGLKAGPIQNFPFHPDAMGLVLAGLFAVLFYLLIYYLVRRTATILTGLNLDRIEASPSAQAALDRLVDEQGPLAAWEALESDEQRALMLSLAQSRTLNFTERRNIQELVAKGYLALTPYLHISNQKLADYLHFDLPRERRLAIMSLAHAEDDKWEHMRIPVFVIVGLGCVLLAYSSPGAVQLVISGFLALTALIPLTRDPIGRIFELNKG